MQRARSRFTLPSWTFSRPLSLYVAYFGLPMVWVLVASFGDALPAAAKSMISPLMLGMLLVPVLLSVLTRVKVTVAQDGVLLRTRLRSTFIRAHTIDRIAPIRGWGVPTSPGVEIVTRGRRHRLYTIPERFHAGKATDPVLEALLVMSQRDRSVSGDASALLSRGSSTLREWMDTLRARIRSGGRGYREIALSPEHLARIVSDATQTDATRAAAVVALAATEDRERLRVTADDVAAPRVRIALEAALVGDDHALERALENASE